MGGYAVPFDQPDQDERYSKVAKLLAGSSVPQPAPVGVAPNPIVAGSSPAIIAQAAQPQPRAVMEQNLQDLAGLKPPDVNDYKTRLGDIQQREKQLAAPTDPYAKDPATGNYLYRPSIGKRLAGIALGIIGGPQATENLLWGKYERAENTRKAGYSAAEKEEQNLDKEHSLMDQDFAKRYTQLKDVGTAANQLYGRDQMQQKVDDQEKKLGGAYDWARATQDEDGTYSAPRLSDGEMVKGLTPPKFLKPESEPKNEYELAMAMSNAQRSGDKDKIAKYQGAFDVIAKLKRAGRNTDASDVAKAIQIAQFRSREEDKATAEIDRKVEKEKHNLQTNPAYALDEDAMAKAAEEIDKKYEAERQQRSQQIQDDADKMLGITKAGKKLQSPKKQVQQPASQQKATPQSHVFSVSAWQKANPGKDVEAAKRLAQSSNYQVTP